ncbi:MAG: polysaccharide deacetylase family protein [Clostridiales bacterium]|jgi:peptidoglycan/xylan/chitin deacetylase (PgdA/CDA1 family)|nr:polysaccharide deacetylase family protein [Clostridiales bacterium]MDR2751687.1 polysaccharide deacetylase family protein [Clostridiales bacterium]
MLRKTMGAITVFLAMVILPVAELGGETTKLPILCYHHVLPDADNKNFRENGIVMSQELFAKHMEYLYTNGYHSVTLEELKSFVFNKTPLPPKSVMITFDDGYESNYLFAYPILKQYGFTSLLFLITGAINVQDVPYNPDELDRLSWLQILAAQDVFTYGSHTYNLHYHTDNTTAIMKASPTEALADFKKSLLRIQDRTIFSYPEGRHNEQIVSMLEHNGITMGFTVKEGYVTMNSNPMLLERITIYNAYGINILEKIVTGRFKQ